jgi:hypothetical protein
MVHMKALSQPECPLQLSVSKDIDTYLDKMRKYNIQPPKLYSALVLGRRV